MSGSLGEQEMVWAYKPMGGCFPVFLALLKFHDQELMKYGALRP